MPQDYRVLISNAVGYEFPSNTQSQRDFVEDEQSALREMLASVCELVTVAPVTDQRVVGAPLVLPEPQDERGGESS